MERLRGDAQWESWYKENWDQIRKVIESKESQQFAGEIEKLKGYLKPITCAARVCHLVEKGFDGRHWLLERVEQWRAGNTDKSRLLWITGKPGFGKSAFAAHLVHNQASVVIAAHFVEWNKRDHRDARNVIRSLAFQLATRLPDYRTLLLDLPEIAALDAKDPDELFDYLIANNLRHAIKGGRARYLVVIDGLDEAGISGRNELVNVLARQAKHLPEWISFVVTSRLESHVTAPLQGLIPQRMDTETKENLDDLKLYLDRKLDKQLAARPNRNQLVKDLLGKSEGVFLYAEHFCEAVIAGHLSLDQPEQFPQGLGGIYYQWFERQFPQDYDAIRPVLGAILAARDPIPVEIIEGRFQWTETQLEKELRKFGSLFLVIEENGNRTIKPYHKAVADWLTDRDKAGDFFISRKEGHATLATFGLTEFKNGVPPDGYFIRHLIPHLVAANQLKEATELLFDLLWLEAKVGAGLAFEIPRDFAIMIEAWKDQGQTDAVLEIIDNAVRSEISFISQSAKMDPPYEQGLMQSVLNYLQPILSPATRDTQPIGFATDTIDRLRQLVTRWTAYKPERIWIKLEWLHRKHDLGGSLAWDIAMPHRDGEERAGFYKYPLAFSPKGEFLAAARSYLFVNRAFSPSWPEAYDIAVYDKETGDCIARLLPDAASLGTDGPPEDIPRPPELEQQFRDYFAMRRDGTLRSFIKKGRSLKAPSWEKFLEAAAKAPKVSEPQIGQGFRSASWPQALHSGDVRALTWLDDETLAIGGRANLIFVFNVRSGRQINMVLGRNDAVKDPFASGHAALDPEPTLLEWNDVKIDYLVTIDAHRLVAGSSCRNIVELVDLHEPTSRKSWAVIGGLRSLAFHRNSNRLAVGSGRGVNIIDVNTSILASELFADDSPADESSEGPVITLAWSPTGERLASISKFKRTLRIWDIATREEVGPSISVPTDSSPLLSWGLEDDEVLTTCVGSAGDCVAVWDVVTGRLKRKFAEAPNTLGSIAVSREQRRVATCVGRYLRMYAPDKPAISTEPLNAHATAIRGASHCALRDNVATVSTDGICTWSTLDGKRLKKGSSVMTVK